MGASPTSGVVDRNGQVFGVNNLYVAGSAVFPTSSQANPTLTIVATALRLAEHLGTIAGRVPQANSARPLVAAA
jgi:choline dehydrogenase-like flavoprotein